MTGQGQLFSPEQQPSTPALVAQIKEQECDFEWYPTTDEILQTIKADMGEQLYDEHPSVLDCGAGDGRALMTLTTGSRYAIEKSKPLLNSMDRSIYVVGTEFREQTLIDKRCSTIFCNPPYSEYAEWMSKIIREANSTLIYFVVPRRWQDNSDIQMCLNKREAKTEVLGEFDFLNADRKARAQVNIVRVNMGYGSRHNSGPRVDPFDLWFEENFKLEINNSETSKYKWEQSSKRKAGEQVRNALVAGSDLISVLENLYHTDLAKLMNNYKSLEQVDQALLRELDVNLDSLKAAIRQKVEGLKDLYWNELFNNLNKITSKLSTASRRRMLEKLTAHTHVDFTAANAHAIMIWILKRANVYFDDQLIETFQLMTEQANVVLYKSNERTFGAEDWRYRDRREKLDRYSLDYRVVLHRVGGISTSQFDFERDKHGGLTESAFDLVNDLLTIANNLGFDTSYSPRAGAFEWESNKAVTFCYYDELRTNKQVELMKVRAFKNGNLHIHFNQAFICRLNVEFGRLKGWLKDHAEAAYEMDMDIVQAAEAFGKNLQLGTDNLPMLGFGHAA